MHSDDTGGRRIPSLVHLCQRVAVAHVDSICNLGSEITFDLAKPILERCTAEQLLRIEESSPHLQCETYDLWMVLCSHRYPKLTQRYLLGEEEDQETWKERYFAMEVAEARRLEELGNRLRSQRAEADERKREREVKLTDSDCLPPPKRSKTGWGMSAQAAQPKSLFQKTRSEASRIQRAVYNARVVPPMPTAKNYTLITKPTMPVLLPPAPNADNQPSRVTVNIVRRPINSSNAVIHNPAKLPTSESEGDSRPTKPPSICGALPERSEKCPPSSSPSLNDPPSRNKTVKSPKKDPMACLFLPKHRPRPTKV
ncbi:hypothetical protein M378DRAFT_719541 [Amanita muscaria Koide BX008]|uniref:Elongin-A n=1 Tax=Amanita muscaria (strain Koide BX008) TaxID=946122 RepID=A0A0C2XLI1_AMAMK|nr:hypothetical protein M378DRAFT_719541 [Amanita muscaria Koide BX008]